MFYIPICKKSTVKLENILDFLKVYKQYKAELVSFIYNENIWNAYTSMNFCNTPQRNHQLEQIFWEVYTKST